MGKIEEQIPQKSVSCLSVDCQLTVGRLSAKRLPFVIGLVLPVCRLSVSRPVGQESTDKQPKDFWHSHSSDLPDDGNFETLILFQSKTSDFSYPPEI